MDTFLVGVYLKRLYEINMWRIPDNLRRGMKGLNTKELLSLLAERELDFVTVGSSGGSKIVNDVGESLFVSQVYVGMRLSSEFIKNNSLIKLPTGMRREAPRYSIEISEELDTIKKDVWSRIRRTDILANVNDIFLYGFKNCVE